MALLGIQAEMPCEGNIPVPRHYSDWNLNVSTNGRAWLSNDVDSIFKNRNYCNGALLLPSPDQHLVQSKELVKQTMLKQEAIFRDQVLFWFSLEFLVVLLITSHFFKPIFIFNRNKTNSTMRIIFKHALINMSRGKFEYIGLEVVLFIDILKGKQIFLML